MPANTNQWLIGGFYASRGIRPIPRPALKPVENPCERCGCRRAFNHLGVLVHAPSGNFICIP